MYVKNSDLSSTIAVEKFPNIRKTSFLIKKHCIFVDEAGFDANLVRGVGYSKKRSQSVVFTQSKRAVNVSILAVISYHGVEDVSFKKVQGGTTGEIFKELIQGIMKKLDDTGLVHTILSWIMPPSTRGHGERVVQELSAPNMPLPPRNPGMRGTHVLVEHIWKSTYEVSAENCQGWVPVH
ncbi:hypothetical protein BD408DRAFT_436535 [Parasitella parasitica]|nr:hypothetical protein BD408DRAFT_436535 [Parasitella parasitica]